MFLQEAARENPFPSVFQLVEASCILLACDISLCHFNFLLPLPFVLLLTFTYCIPLTSAPLGVPSWLSTRNRTSIHEDAVSCGVGERRTWILCCCRPAVIALSWELPYAAGAGPKKTHK